MNKIIHTKLLTLLAGILLPSILLTTAVYATESEDTSVTYSTMYIPGVTNYNVDGDVTLDVNVAEINALEITLSTSNLAIDLTPKIGIPSFDTDTLDILVGTTNITGYTLTMASSYNGNSTTSLTRTESISSTVPTIDTIGSTITPTDFASTSDTSSINKWGYLLSATNLDVNKTVYNPVLSSNTVNSSTEAVYNDPTTITFGAKVDSDLPAGNYRATLKFMAVSNINTYSIMYNAGSASSDSTLANMPSPNPQTGALEGGGSTTIVLSNASPSRTGYSFINWCSVSPTTSNNTDSCNGTTYSAGGNMEISNSEPDVSLYAMWGVDTYAVNITNSNTTSSASSIYVPYGGSATVTVTPSSGYYLSNVSCPEHYTCTGYNTGTSYTGQQTVTITNNNYAGGGTVGFSGTVIVKVYMQNWTGCSSMTTGDTTTLYDNRDETPYLVGKAKDGKCWMLQDLKLGAKASSYTLDSTNSATNGFTLNGKLSDGKFTFSTNNGYDYTNDSSQFYCTSDYGCYYNWYTATAGSGTSATGAEVTVNYSICPKGWNLPTGGSSGEFQALYNQYNSAALMLVDNPTTTKENTAGKIPGFLLGGRYVNSGAIGVGSYGNYWSRTANSGQFGYLLYLDTSSVSPAYNFNKYNGYSVRCLAQ